MVSLTARRWITLFIIIVAVLAVDQISKRYVVDHVPVGQSVRPIPALADYFQITHSRNTGSAFGILPQAGDIFLIVAIVVVVAMVIFFPRIDPRASMTRLATALVCGGALGNALNRLEYGYVVDFIHYQIPGLISNVSNLADHAIVFGVLLIFAESLRLDRKKPSGEDAAALPEGDET